MADSICPTSRAAPDLGDYEAYLRAQGLDDDEVESALARVEWRRRRGYKRCASCRRPLPVSAFGVDSYRQDGLHNVCKSCR